MALAWMPTHPRPPTDATLPIDAVLSREAAHRWQGRGGAPVQTAREWSRHDQGGRRRIDPRISAWLPSARSSRRDGQTAQREAAATCELLWARTQLSHTGPVPTGPRGRARQHRAAGASWRDARGQHISPVPHSGCGPQRRAPCTSLRRPGTPQERSLLIPGVCQHRTCVFSPFPADLDDFGVVIPYPGLAALFATVCCFQWSPSRRLEIAPH